MIVLQQDECEENEWQFIFVYPPNWIKFDELSKIFQSKFFSEFAEFS